MPAEENRSFAEIATELTITVSVVKKKLYEARDYVRVNLGRRTGISLPLIIFFFTVGLPGVVMVNLE